MIIVASIVINFSVTYAYDVGSLPVWITPLKAASDPNKEIAVSTDFFNKVYMQSYYHLGSYAGGVALALVYRKFLRERNPNADLKSISRSTRAATVFSENSCFRLFGYFIGLLMILGSFFWLYPFIKAAENTSRVS